MPMQKPRNPKWKKGALTCRVKQEQAAKEEPGIKEEQTVKKEQAAKEEPGIKEEQNVKKEFEVEVKMEVDVKTEPPDEEQEPEEQREWTGWGSTIEHPPGYPVQHTESSDEEFWTNLHESNRRYQEWYQNMLANAVHSRPYMMNNGLREH